MEELSLVLLVSWELDSKSQLFYHHIYTEVAFFLSRLVLPTPCVGWVQGVQMGDSAQIRRTWDFGFLQMTFWLVLLVQKLVSPYCLGSLLWSQMGECCGYRAPAFSVQKLMLPSKATFWEL